MKIKKKLFRHKKKVFLFILLKVKRDQTFHYHYVCDTMPSYVSYKYACMYICWKNEGRRKAQKTDISYFNPGEFSDNLF